MDSNDRLLRLIPALFALALLAAPIPVSAQAGALDGKVYVGETGEKGKPAHEKDDVITFKEGAFHSSACDKWGYGKGAYKAVTEGDAIAFETETVSEKDGRIAWKGVAKGDTLEGTFIYYRKSSFFRPNPEPKEHWFKAKLKQ